MKVGLGRWPELEKMEEMEMRATKDPLLNMEDRSEMRKRRRSTISGGVTDSENIVRLQGNCVKRRKVGENDGNSAETEESPCDEKDADPQQSGDRPQKEDQQEEPQRSKQRRQRELDDAQQQQQQQRPNA